ARAQLAGPVRHAAMAAYRLEKLADAGASPGAGETKKVAGRQDERPSVDGAEVVDQPFEGGELKIQLVAVDRQLRPEQAHGSAGGLRGPRIMAADMVPG